LSNFESITESTGTLNWKDALEFSQLTCDDGFSHGDLCFYSNINNGVTLQCQVFDIFYGNNKISHFSGFGNQEPEFDLEFTFDGANSGLSLILSFFFKNSLTLFSKK